MIYTRMTARILFRFLPTVCFRPVCQDGCFCPGRQSPGAPSHTGLGDLPRNEEADPGHHLSHDYIGRLQSPWEVDGHHWETARGHTAGAAPGPGPEQGPAYGLSSGLPRTAALCLPPALPDILLLTRS